jgi:hypothetical protein
MPQRIRRFFHFLSADEDRTVISLLSGSALLLLVLAIFSKGYYGGADVINHYFIARYAFENPHLFLDAWGRPLFTLLAAPFSFAGLKGIMVMNIILAVVTAWNAYRIAGLLEMKPAWPVVIFVIFPPLYFLLLLSCLTEITFAAVLVSSVRLLLERRFTLAAAVLSLLPFARTEGLFLLPLFAVYLLFVKKWRSVPFLLSAFLLWSVAGGLLSGDPFWALKQFPYRAHNDLYDAYHGSFWHFVNNRDYILGLPLELTFLAGILKVLLDLIRRQGKEKTAIQILSLVFLPFLVYFLFHSMLYALGMGGSIGLIRVMAAVLPLASILCLPGFIWILSFFRRESHKGYFTAVYLLIVALNPFLVDRYPVPDTTDTKMLKQAAAYLISQESAGTKIYYTDISFPFYLGLNPYDTAISEQVFKISAIDGMKQASLFLWDSHFGANECLMPPDSVKGRKDLVLMKRFAPLVTETTLGGYPYEVLVFRKIKVTGQ